jgi:hypothetical protein
MFLGTWDAFRLRTVSTEYPTMLQQVSAMINISDTLDLSHLKCHEIPAMTPAQTGPFRMTVRPANHSLNPHTQPGHVHPRTLYP